MKWFTLSLALLLTTIAPVAAYAGEDTAVLQEITINGFAGESVSFEREDFTESLAADDGALRGIVLVRLPESGSLVFAQRELLVGEAMTTETLNALSFVPETSGNQRVSFQFIPVYNDDSAQNPVFVNLVLTHKENLPPEAQDVEASTYRDVAIRARFIASDPEGDAVSYRITTKAKRGEVEIDADGSFVYSPFHKKTGNDSFKYVAVDAYGNTSEEATVKIRIEKPSTKTTYADMEGNDAAYAALRLHEAGIFTGENVCGVYYFRPQQTMSRAELITMAVKLITPDELPAVSHTGFADDADIPVWFKPYAQAALKCGIISGSQTSDGRIFIRAGDPVSYNEAAVILNNAIALSDVNALTDLSVPVWAAQAVSNMEAAQALPISVSDYAAPVTRADGALMLSKAVDIHDQNQKKSGLLSWVFGW